MPFKKVEISFDLSESPHCSSTPRGIDSVLIKFIQLFEICGVFELFSMKIKLESPQNDSKGFKYSRKALRCHTKVSGLSKLFLAQISSSIK